MTLEKAIDVYVSLLERGGRVLTPREVDLRKLADLRAAAQESEAALEGFGTLEDVRNFGIRLVRDPDRITASSFYNFAFDEADFTLSIYAEDDHERKEAPIKVIEVNQSQGLILRSVFGSGGDHVNRAEFCEQYGFSRSALGVHLARLRRKVGVPIVESHYVGSMRLHRQLDEPVQIGDVEYDPGTGKALQNGSEIRIHSGPQQVLNALLDNRGQVLSLQNLADLSSITRPASALTYISRIRSAIDPKVIETVEGGYRMPLQEELNQNNLRS